MSVLKFRKALESKAADEHFRWWRQVWSAIRGWWYNPNRWHIWWSVEWNYLHIIPVWPPWRWQWQVPWATYRQKQPVDDHFYLQIIVLKFDFQFKITKTDVVERPLANLLTLAAIIYYFGWCR